MNRELNPEHATERKRVTELIQRSIARTGIARVVFRATEGLEPQEPVIEEIK